MEGGGGRGDGADSMLARKLAELELIEAIYPEACLAPDGSGFTVHSGEAATGLPWWTSATVL